jgi:MFS family permease
MSAARVLAASLIGTTIEFFDFYIYATAAVLVFPASVLSIDRCRVGHAAVARDVCARILCPPDRLRALRALSATGVGRKATLVAALVTMGLSTVLIGLLPTYATAGIVAPLMLALCRFGQGLGLGGEWGGAVLLATENAPPGRRAWYGMFPQLGAPLGFLCSSGVFLLLSQHLTEAQFLAFGWRLPFLASALLVVVGLYMRLRLTETPAFRRAIENNERVRLPMRTVCTVYRRALILGTFAATATFVLFYLMTVFALSWGTQALGYTRTDFLLLQMLGVLFFAATIPVSAAIADRRGCRPVLLVATAAIAVFGLLFAPLFGSGNTFGVGTFMALGLALMGLTYGPLGTALAQMFPTAVRYTLVHRLPSTWPASSAHPWRRI